MRVWLLALTACAGMRGSLDQAGDEIRELHTYRTGERVAVQPFGGGCYSAGRSVYACSIDVLPVGERICFREPGDGRAILLGDPMLGPFERELNEHRCHRRLQEQLACDPVQLEAHRVSGEGLVDVPTLFATVDLSPLGRGDIHNDGRTRIEFEAVMCGERGLVQPSPWYFVGHGTTPFFIDLLVAMRGGSTASPGCARYRAVATGIRCML